jgi:hypothetical protein
MALNSGEMSAADIAAVTGNNGGFGGWGDGSFWIIVLFLFALMGNGWNNGFGGNGGVAPMVYNDTVQAGFDQAAVMGGINGLNTTVANGFANAEVSRCNQTANLTSQLSAIALNQATGLCNTNTNIADLKYTVATENCADRAALNEALMNVTAQNTANTQRILDQMCQDKIDAKNEEIQNLRTQLNLANLAASQGAQTAQILADNAAQTFALEQYLAPVPKPAYIVQNPNCCQQNYGCGCGM